MEELLTSPTPSPIHNKNDEDGNKECKEEAVNPVSKVVTSTPAQTTKPTLKKQLSHHAIEVILILNVMKVVGQLKIFFFFSCRLRCSS